VRDLEFVGVHAEPTNLAGGGHCKSKDGDSV
jgi:hypothetical protein